MLPGSSRERLVCETEIQICHHFCMSLKPESSWQGVAPEATLHAYKVFSAQVWPLHKTSRLRCLHLIAVDKLRYPD